MNKSEEIKPVRAWALHINNEPRITNMFYTQKDGILHGWRAEDLVEVEIRPVQQEKPISFEEAIRCEYCGQSGAHFCTGKKASSCQPIAHDKAEACNKEQALRNQMLEAAQELYEYQRSSRMTAMPDWEAMYWEVRKEIGALETEHQLDKDRADQLEDKLRLKEECRRNEQSQLMKKNADLEDEVKDLKWRNDNQASTIAMLREELSSTRNVCGDRFEEIEKLKNKSWHLDAAWGAEKNARIALESEVARLDSLKCKAQVEALELKGKLDEAREALKKISGYGDVAHMTLGASQDVYMLYASNLGQCATEANQALSSLNEADKTKENG